MFLLATLPTIVDDPASVRFVDRTVTTPEATYAYQVFVPKGGRGKRPAILFLHGSGERGVDNRAQTRNGIRLLIARDTARFPAIVVAPQCRPDLRWTDPAMTRMALAAFEDAIRAFNGDPERQYLTGLSLGGYGTWAYAAQEPRRWAAIAPVCGGIAQRGRPTEISRGEDAYSATAQKIRAIPVWAFHGALDPTVPVSESRQMVAGLFTLGARLKYTEYPGVGHNSWDAAYNEPKLLSWLLSHRRGRPGR